ncbi:UNVERIFIED_CONTAM: hypothetical protein FKN15_019092 [Acipenser sinensis]
MAQLPSHQGVGRKQSSHLPRISSTAGPNVCPGDIGASNNAAISASGTLACDSHSCLRATTRLARLQEQRTTYEAELHGHQLWERGLHEHAIQVDGRPCRPPTGGARTRAAMVESIGGNCASPIASAPSMEGSADALLETLGAEARCCQEALTSSRKSGNTWEVEVCSGLKTELHFLETAFQAVPEDPEAPRCRGFSAPMGA